MSVIDKLACSLGRNDEVPNQELARELYRTRDEAAICELAQALFEGTDQIRNDCIKVLYEIGEVKPELIAFYATDFIKLLRSKNNRLIWGAMTALATIAPLNPDPIFANVALIFDVIKHGSVITVDNGVSVLARIGAANRNYEAKVLPFLLEHLATCRPKEVAQHAERTLAIANAENKRDIQKVLEQRLEDLNPSQLTRVKKVMKVL